ncbi:MAG: hypothetical protein ACFFBQ_05530, partial [Promethearchaeota archaeon]
NRRTGSNTIREFGSTTGEIKEEKNFALDVYRYLNRRYPKTVVVDYGGLASDPIIQSRDAGPFKLIEVKVVTKKVTDRSDRDLILRGEVNPEKFHGEKSVSLSLDPQFRWQKYNHDIVIGIPRLDDRFIISSDDSHFPRQLLTQSDLGNLLQKSFDLEGYHIRWLSAKSPIIQVEMETMNTNSFIQAFNIPLGTVGALSDKGYLTRSAGTGGKPIIHIPSYTPTKVVEDYDKVKVSDIKEESNVLDTIEESISPPQEPVISWEPLPETSAEVAKSYKFQEKPIESPYQSLFSSIHYQAKSIDFEPSRVRIVTYSRASEEIIVTFPENEKATFTTFSDLSPSEEFELQINFQNEARPIDWSNAWKDIDVFGPPDIVEKLIDRTGIAHRIADTGRTKVIVRNQPTKERIIFEITVPKTIRGINAGYSLLKDVIWFFEMVFM